MITCSTIFVPSRKLPRAARAISRNASGSNFTFSPVNTCSKLKTASSIVGFLNFTHTHRDFTVSNSFSGSVVHNTNNTCSGGSSNVLSRALAASVVNICTSSITYTLYLAFIGASLTLSRSSLISSIPRLLAASISTISVAAPAVISTHNSHLLHGSTPSLCKQFTVLAKILAADVFPVPHGPVNNHA